MAEYIEKQAVIDAVKCRFSMPVDNLIVEVISAIPAADVRPVVRGEWIECQYPLPLSDGSKTAYKCSICATHWDDKTRCCPNCGAEMKGAEG